MEVKIVSMFRSQTLVSKKSGKTFGYSDALVTFDGDSYLARFWLKEGTPLPDWKGGERVTCKLNECKKSQPIPSLTLYIR